ncbi:adaptin ear-binding coat-associated protein 2 [Sarocladium implicatum]|nr:adaptin ear-binding coat-associated protein 2 [Sarocladium implicatum]
MELLDPTTGKALSSDAIQRVLFLAPAAHVYNIPPLQSTKGHSASTWTTPASRHIFTARLRIIETDDDSSSPSLKIDIVLEDPSTGQLFAAAPYTEPSVVEPVIDSSRFFAVMVRDPQGRKAMLGVGFEERSDAFDFGVALQEARKALGLEGRGDGGASRGGKKEEPKTEEPPKDYSLKEGETITVNFGGSKTGRRRPQADSSAVDSGADLQSFALAPPPSAASSASSASGAGSEGGFALPPPPSATDVKTKRRSIRDMGFDDGKFGEFA